MRATEGFSAPASVVGLPSSSGLTDLQNKLSTGRQITRPSDSPTGTVSALQLRGELSRANQYQSNGTDALDWLRTVDSALEAVCDQLQAIRSLVCQAMNIASEDGASLEALAQQVDQARSSLLSLANTAYLGRPVFGGTTAGSIAFDNTGAYVGDSGAVTRTVAANTIVTLNTDGPTVFGANGSNVFDLLGSICDNLRRNPSALGANLTSLDNYQMSIASDRSLAGAKYNRIQAAQATAVTHVVALESQLSDVQDIDLADMAVQVSTANAVYQEALATTAQIKQISLLDFLK